jgi:methyl-accepting chemotaxis protein
MQGLRTVSQSINELGQMTQQNVAVAEGASTAATELHAQVHRLSEVLSSFNLGADGAPAPQPAPTAALAHPVASRTARPAATAAAGGGGQDVEYF